MTGSNWQVSHTGRPASQRLSRVRRPPGHPRQHKKRRKKHLQPSPASLPPQGFRDDAQGQDALPLASGYENRPRQQKKDQAASRNKRERSHPPYLISAFIRHPPSEVGIENSKGDNHLPLEKSNINPDTKSIRH
ncbi:hypothetical protein [Cupriavidus basilensis]|uniref:hypothetical protein n=1 Tax=Cupriavidus basilensis TaxID=68895 RepID=UPI00157A31FD|nr:hypothetical protein [Cupriavidus basilensis]NUA29708.1 hypothetical protein [Cupriavidus basilensis]